MNKQIIYTAGLALLLALSSCSNEPSPDMPDVLQDAGSISFTLGGSAGAPVVARTRGEGETIQNENEQHVNSLYVVSYKANQMKAVVQATKDEVTGKWAANVGASGSLELYFVANPSADLVQSMQSLAVGSYPSALLALTESTAPKTDGTENAFLMTAHQVASVSTSGDVATDIGSIGLQRAANRIDITSVPSGFSITSVTFVNRYTQTKLGRIGDSDNSMVGLACSDQLYTLSAPAATYVGMIYGYEDLVGTTAQLVINGTYGGLAVTGITVNFGVPLKRNTIYSVALSNTGGSTTLGNISAQLTVVDWDSSITLSKTTAEITNRTDTDTPSALAFSSLNNCNENGGNISIANKNEASFVVTVTNVGSTLSKLVCTGISYDGGSTTLTTGEGISITSDAPVYNPDGTSSQSFTVSITQNTETSGRVFTLKAENLLNRDASLTFTVTQN